MTARQDLRSLKNRLNKRVEKISKESKLVQKVAKTVLNELVNNTPVDTSKAISNYQVGLVIPIRTTREAFFKGSGGDTAGTSGAETIKRGNLVINQRKDGQDIYITNNQPYVAELDGDGFHTPFIKPAVKRGREVAKNGR